MNSGKGSTEKNNKVSGIGAGIAQEAEALRTEGGTAGSADDIFITVAQRAAAEEKISKQSTITVNQDGDGDYRTIGEAITGRDARANIKVECGMYNESLVIDQDGITMQGIVFLNYNVILC